MKKLSFFTIALLTITAMQIQSAPLPKEKQRENSSREDGLNLTVNSATIENTIKLINRTVEKVKDVQSNKAKIVKNFSVAKKTRTSMSQSPEIEKYKADAEQSLHRINTTISDLENLAKEFSNLADKAASESSSDVQTLHDDNDMVIAKLQDQQQNINKAAAAAAAAAQG